MSKRQRESERDRDRDREREKEREKERAVNEEHAREQLLFESDSRLAEHALEGERALSAIQAIHVSNTSNMSGLILSVLSAIQGEPRLRWILLTRAKNVKMTKNVKG